MKKSIYLLSILIMGFILNTFGQDTIRLSFTAQYNQEQLSLDSILIMNLSQGVDATLYAPDTVLELIFDTIGVNIRDLQRANSFSVSQNYPNPVIDQTFIDISIAKRDDIEIRIYDLSGRGHASYEGVLDAGIHTFTFYPGNANFYIFSVSYGGLTRSIKMASPLSVDRKCKITHSSFEKREGALKAQRDANFPYEWGDNLRYIGYSKTTELIRGSDVIEDTPDKNELYIFDIAEGIPCVDVPTVLYSLRIYNTLQIGTQCWLKENINVGTMVLGVQNQLNNGTIEKYCYDNDPANCGVYGGLYQWDEMMQYTSEPGAQGICPPGWHIPSDEEWKVLEGAVDSYYGYPDPVWDEIDYRGLDVGEGLKSRMGWDLNGNGNDNFGFCAMPHGCRRFIDGAFLGKGEYTCFWSSTEGSSTTAWYRYTEAWMVQVARHDRDNTFGRGVRCVRD